MRRQSRAHLREGRRAGDVAAGTLLDRNLGAAARLKTFEDCVAERHDMWQWQRYAQPVKATIELISAAIRNHGRIYFFGNGGSAAEGQHPAAAVSGRLLLDRERGAGLALSVD